MAAGLQGAGATGDDIGVLKLTHKDYEAALAERDERIAEFKGEIAEVAKTAESAERLRKEVDELRRKGGGEHIGFELQIAGAQMRRWCRIAGIDDEEW